MPRPRYHSGALCPVLLAACAIPAWGQAPTRPDLPWSPPGSPANDFTLPANPLVGTVPPAPSLDQEHAFTLAELIDIAQSNNSATRVAWNNARDLALATGIAKSTYLPQLSASVVGGYQKVHNSAGQQIEVSGESSSDGVVSAISLQWLLFDFGERAAVVGATRQLSTAANILFNAAHQHIIHEVSLAFYAHDAARARVATAARTLKNAEAVQEAADARRVHGIGTVVEVAQATQVTAQARLLEVQAEGGAEDSYLALISAMGISPLTRIRIAELVHRALPDSLVQPVDQVVADALARRPDVLAAYATQQASLENVRAARAEFLPKVFLSATGAYNNNHLDLSSLPSLGQGSPGTVNLTGNQFGGTIFLGVTMPLYDGRRRSSLLEQARIRADSAQVTLNHTKEEAVREIVVAQNGLRTALSAHAAASSLLTAAETTFEAALAAYRNGVGSITDVTMAESALLQAQNAACDSYSEALSASATLALAMGALGSAPQ